CRLIVAAQRLDGLHEGVVRVNEALNVLRDRRGIAGYAELRSAARAGPSGSRTRESQGNPVDRVTDGVAGAAMRDAGDGESSILGLGVLGVVRRVAGPVSQRGEACSAIALCDLDGVSGTCLRG